MPQIEDFRYFLAYQETFFNFNIAKNYFTISIKKMCKINFFSSYFEIFLFFFLFDKIV